MPLFLLMESVLQNTEVKYQEDSYVTIHIRWNFTLSPVYVTLVHISKANTENILVLEVSK